MIRTIHVAGSVQLARRLGARIQVVASVGNTILEIAPVRVYSANQKLGEGAWLNCVEIGDERTLEQDVLRLAVPFPTWEDYLSLALEKSRICGTNGVQLMRRMTALVRNLLEVLPAQRHNAMRHWEERLKGTVERSFEDAEEKTDASVADRQGLGIGEDDADDAK